MTQIDFKELELKYYRKNETILMTILALIAGGVIGATICALTILA